MKQHELDYVEHMKNEVTKLTEESSRYKMRTEILAKRVQRNLLEAIEKIPADERINFKDLMKLSALTAADVVDICGVILIEAQQKADEHNQKLVKKK